MVYSQPVNIGVGRVSAGMDDATSSLVGSRVVITYLFANTICGRSGIYPKQYVCMSYHSPRNRSWETTNALYGLYWYR